MTQCMAAVQYRLFTVAESFMNKSAGTMGLAFLHYLPLQLQVQQLIAWATYAVAALQSRHMGIAAYQIGNQ